MPVSRTRSARTLPLLAAFALLFPACGVEDNGPLEAGQEESHEESVPEDDLDPLLAPLPDPASKLRARDEDVADAADEFAVPPQLLQAIVGDGAGLGAGLDIRALREQARVTGARLIGEDVALVEGDRRASIRATAALLSSHADELDIDRGQWSAWSSVLARYSAAAP